MAGYFRNEWKCNRQDIVRIAADKMLSTTADIRTNTNLPVVTGWLGLMCAIVAVGMPTAIRAAIDGSVTGCEFTPYLPFVLLAAILLGWWRASLVALASVAVLGGLFLGPLDHFLATSCARSAAGVFIASSAIIIAVVTAARLVIEERQSERADAAAGGIIFSLDNGEVWASWNGSGPPMRLGPQERVEAMMEDFLAQGQLGKRLKEITEPDSVKR